MSDGSIARYCPAKPLGNGRKCWDNDASQCSFPVSSSVEFANERNEEVIP